MSGPELGRLYAYVDQVDQVLTVDAVAAAGGHAELAELLGIARTSIYGWGEFLPALRVYQLRALALQGWRDQVVGRLETCCRLFREREPAGFGPLHDAATYIETGEWGTSAQDEPPAPEGGV